jgi:hypothetical protein
MALERHVHDVVLPRLLDGVRECLGGCELEVEPLLGPEAAPLREPVDRSAKLARGRRALPELEIDSRRLMDASNTPSVPNGIPNCINGSNG